MLHDCIAGTLGRLSRERLASVIGNIVDILSRDAAVLKRLRPLSFQMQMCPTTVYSKKCKHVSFIRVCRYEPNLRDAGLWKEETCTPVVPLSEGTKNDKDS